ncbi:MAG: methylenetetrahydrofolate reductase [NAD(P)H] [Cyanobacteria bacterium REEB459]|nr:methylenetetrahydrofolate reductase [NAD(P)H] [Cyanobacteria bacterium REEB459]
MTINTLPLSFEFFPPKNQDDISQLMVQHELLVPYGPRFFSITYGAGGSTRDRTTHIVMACHQRAGIPAVPHLSCVGDTRESLKRLLDTYRAAGISRIVALRGDRPQDGAKVAHEFYYASELVAFIRECYGDTFELIVGAYPEVHPESANASQDLINFKRKVDAGASAAITQYFYNPDAYEDFINRCQQQGITIPIYPGIMPITNHDRLVRFSARCGAEIPRWIEKRLLDYEHDAASLKAFGSEVVIQLCEKLMAMGAPGFHFYILNQAQPTLDILNRLGRPQRVTQAA